MLEIYREIVRMMERGEKGALATVVGCSGSTPGKESAKMLIRADGTSFGTIGGGRTEAEVLALAREVMAAERPIRRSFELNSRAAEEDGLICGGIVEIFIEPIGDPVVLIFGAGHIARSLVRIASIVGLRTIVIDDREEFASRAHFPEPTGILVSDFSSAFQKLSITESTSIVIVTRGHRFDLQVLAEAIRTPASYIGLIGSKSKIQGLFSALISQGADPAKLRSVKAPIGLDIGARTAEEIALSIAAQLVARRRRSSIKGTDPDRLLDREENEIEPPCIGN